MGVRSFLLLVLALMVTVNCLLLAQTETATLSGYVTDPDGKVLAHADVQVVNVETNIAQTTQTNDVGLYLFPNLHPGKYRISVKSPGFKEYVKQDLYARTRCSFREFQNADRIDIRVHNRRGGCDFRQYRRCDSKYGN